jgi:hypothetical protein
VFGEVVLLPEDRGAGEEEDEPDEAAAMAPWHPSHRSLEATPLCHIRATICCAARPPEDTAVRRISVASADRLIRRQGWRKHPGNDGRARVLVPRTWAEPRHGIPTDAARSKPTDQNDHPTDTPPADPTDKPPDPTDKTFVISVLQAAVEAQSKRADRAEAEAESLAERATLAEEQREQFLKDLRLEREQRAAEAARLQAELGQALADIRAERSRLEWAETGKDGERSRADMLRDRLDAAENELRQAREAADQARQHARDAEDAIEEARRADAARKARGRWARLRAAWRGQ